MWALSENMFVFPLSILQNLRCASCDGYLRSAPIMLNDVSHQLCGKCSKLIPQQEITNYRHELGLETVVKLFKFPCRYHMQGCDATFKFNEDIEHEARCLFKYNIQIPDLVENISTYSNQAPDGTDVTKSADGTVPGIFHITTSEFDVLLKTEAGGNRYGQYSNNLKMSMEITGNGTNQIILSNKKEISKILVEAELEMITPPRITSLSAKSKKLEDNIYETLSHYDEMHTSKKICESCGAVLYGILIQCEFGHKLCEICRNSMCRKCSSNENTSFCANRHRGCELILEKDTLSKHIIECEFNLYKCPVNECNHKDILYGIGDHIRHRHNQIVVESNKLEDIIEKRDKIWFLIFFDKVFKCVYNFYYTHIEILVIYIGRNDDALKYKYTVELVSTENRISGIRKQSTCIGWNSVSLDRAVQIDIDHLIKKTFDRIFKFEISIEVITL